MSSQAENIDVLIIGRRPHEPSMRESALILADDFAEMLRAQLVGERPRCRVFKEAFALARTSRPAPVAGSKSASSARVAANGW